MEILKYNQLNESKKDEYSKLKELIDDIFIDYIDEGRFKGSTLTKRGYVREFENTWDTRGDLKDGDTMEFLYKCELSTAIGEDEMENLFKRNIYPNIFKMFSYNVDSSFSKKSGKKYSSSKISLNLVYLKDVFYHNEKLNLYLKKLKNYNFTLNSIDEKRAELTKRVYVDVEHESILTYFKKYKIPPSDYVSYHSSEHLDKDTSEILDLLKISLSKERIKIENVITELKNVNYSKRLNDYDYPLLNLRTKIDDNLRVNIYFHLVRISNKSDYKNNVEISIKIIFTYN